MKFELYRSLTLFRKRWRWRLKAANGEIIATGEDYRNKVDALRTIQLIRRLDINTPCKEL